jgi:hypothetical protein
MTMLDERPVPASKPLPRLVTNGEELEAAHVGWLRDSNDILTDPAALRERMANDGYLFLPGLLNREDVLAARKTVCERLAAMGAIDAVNHPLTDAVAVPENVPGFAPDKLADGNPELMKVLYSGPLMEFFDGFFGEMAMHYDFTWFRSVKPGHGTRSHCDVVYMGRGETERLFTAWTPIGDIDFVQGGLIILEGSNKNVRLKKTYGSMDIDSYCENKPDAKAWGKAWGTGGQLNGNPNQLRKSITGPDGRWLTTEYRAGDVLIFSVFTVHASLDNQSKHVRMSSDSRYQPKSGVADNRWMGPHPPAHGEAGKRGKIC